MNVKRLGGTKGGRGDLLSSLWDQVVLKIKAGEDWENLLASPWVVAMVIFIQGIVVQ